jgi:hypothetical protein
MWKSKQRTTLPKAVIRMLTPCVFKRGFIWLLFFVLSLFVVPFFAEDNPAPQRSTSSSVSSK